MADAADAADAAAHDNAIDGDSAQVGLLMGRRNLSNCPRRLPRRRDSKVAPRGLGQRAYVRHLMGERRSSMGQNL